MKKLPKESDSTAHISVVDQTGMAVSSTHTLNGLLGSAVVVKGTGIVLNNQMDDFTTRPGKPNLFGLIDGEENKIEAQKRMLSSMSPSFVFDKQGKLLLVFGSPGGSRIITICLQVFLNLFDKNMSLKEAVKKARLHHSGFQMRFYEKNALSTEEVSKLKLYTSQKKVLKLGSCTSSFKKEGRIYWSIRSKN